MDGGDPDADTRTLFKRTLRFGRLSAVFQPLFSLEDGSLFGFEGLIRGPASTMLHEPKELFAIADDVGDRVALEISAARIVGREFAAQRLPGHLLLNLSCRSLLAYRHDFQRAIALIREAGLSPSTVMIEITEHERVNDVPALIQALIPFRDAGISVVLDDFGDGHSNLRLWMELRPRMVKIDRFFVKGLGTDGDKFEIVRLLMRFAGSFGTQVVAEGVENLIDLLAARDLGVPYAQGFLLGEPRALPNRHLSPDVQSAVRSSKLPVRPPREGTPLKITLAGDLMIPVPPVSGRMTSNGLAALFAKNPDWPAIALVDAGETIGLINRHTFVDRYARPFEREVHGNKSCRVFSDNAPFVVDRRTPLESMRSLLSGTDQRYLRDGFVISDNGRYFGVATGESLVRAVTELRVEAARYANPLTLLPGNIPISQHLDRLLESGAPFTACYSDLNHFKPFNDQFGYWRGDEMICLASAAIQEVTDPLVDFVGHVGGDDFFIVFQSADWENRCRSAVTNFNERARNFFPENDIVANGFWGEDRKGIRCFFPLASMSIGAVLIKPGAYVTHEEVASAAALAKRHAKSNGVDLHVVDGDLPGQQKSKV